MYLILTTHQVLHSHVWLVAPILHVAPLTLCLSLNVSLLFLPGGAGAG